MQSVIASKPRADTMPAQPKPTRGLPKWAALLILLLVVTGAGWGVWRYFEGPGELSAAAEAKLTDTNVDGPALPRGNGGWGARGARQRPPNFGQFAARFAMSMPDGIIPAGNGFVIKSGTVRLNIDSANGRNNRADWRFRYAYTNQNIETPPEINAFQAARRAINDPAAAQKLGTTQMQIQELRGLSNNGGGGGGGGAGMVVDASDRARISALFHTWLVATGRSTSPTTRPVSLPAPTPQAKTSEEQLLAALADIGKRQLEPTRRDYAQRAQRISAILGDGTPQKLKPAG
jgi:hypothetical protein